MEEKKKSNKIALIIVVIVLVVASFIGGYFVASNMNHDQKKEEEKKEEEVVESNLPITEENKAWMSEFITVASAGGSRSNTLPYFSQGVSEINLNTRLLMVLYSLQISEDENVPQSVRDELSANREKIYSVSISDVSSKYQYFFHEEIPQYTKSDFQGFCPFVAKIDENTGKLYLLSRCGGLYPVETNKIVSFESDKDYYYVHEELSHYSTNGDTGYPTTETMYKKLLWVFDKNLNFVKTEVE